MLVRDQGHVIARTRHKPCARSHRTGTASHPRSVFARADSARERRQQNTRREGERYGRYLPHFPPAHRPTPLASGVQKKRRAGQQASRPLIRKTASGSWNGFLTTSLTTTLPIESLPRRGKCKEHDTPFLWGNYLRPCLPACWAGNWARYSRIIGVKAGDLSSGPNKISRLLRIRTGFCLLLLQTIMG